MSTAEKFVKDNGLTALIGCTCYLSVRKTDPWHAGTLTLAQSTGFPNALVSTAHSSLDFGASLRDMLSGARGPVSLGSLQWVSKISLSRRHKKIRTRQRARLDYEANDLIDNHIRLLYAGFSFDHLRSQNAFVNRSRPRPNGVTRIVIVTAMTMSTVALPAIQICGANA